MTRLPLDDIIAIKRSRRHDGQRRRRRGVRRCAASLARRPSTSCRRRRWWRWCRCWSAATDGRARRPRRRAGRARCRRNVADPTERLQRTSDALRPRPSSDASRCRRRLMQDVSMFAPPALSALAGRLVGALPHRSLASPTVNLAITNVPRPARADVPRRAPAGGQLPGADDQRAVAAAHRPAVRPGRDRRRRAVLPRHARRTSTSLVERMPVELDAPRRRGRPATRASRSTRNRRAT